MNTLAIFSASAKPGEKEVLSFSSVVVTHPTGESLVPGKDTEGDVKWEAKMKMKADPGNDGGKASGTNSNGTQSVVQAGGATVNATTGVETDLYVATVDPTLGETPSSILQTLAADLWKNGHDAQFDSTTDELDAVNLPAVGGVTSPRSRHPNATKPLLAVREPAVLLPPSCAAIRACQCRNGQVNRPSQSYAGGIILLWATVSPWT